MTDTLMFEINLSKFIDIIITLMLAPTWQRFTDCDFMWPGFEDITLKKTLEGIILPISGCKSHYGWLVPVKMD